ncbi:MAG: hypothetical protein RLZZ175_3210 [Bacteroidota bacterium]|jgi:secreted PhoX family phosphatase
MKKIYSFASLLLAAYMSASAQTTAVTLLGQGTLWKYLDNGSNQGTTWRATSFADATWKSGNAQLGYGDGDESTIVSFGTSSTNKFITTYFRKAITVSNLAELSAISMKVKRDDGIVVYVNGTERYRNNMPTGTISSTTVASADASDDGNTWFTATLAASNFVEGNNVIAVEIHQRSKSSSDISFDMEITATRNTPDTTPPVLSSVTPADNGTNISIANNLILTFNENVAKGTGAFTIKENGVATQTIDVASANVTVSGNVVTINPADFGLNKNVSVSFPAGTIKDIAGFNFAGIANDTDWNFTTQSQVVVCNSISCFTSVQPSAQGSTLVLPSTHTFQLLFKQGNAYTSGGSAPAGFDFTGYVPKSGSSANGYVSINHENSPGGVSILDVSYNATSKLWTRNNAYPVSFANVVKTERNCSGAVTPWGTIITAEETRNTGDVNGDGYTDTGWLVEIDPVTRLVKQYGNAKEEKLWAMGRMSHENAVVAADNKTVYYGEDDPSGALYKFVANTAGNLYTGTLYVLKLTGSLSGGEPTSTTATWVQVPNTTQSDRNNTYSLASGLGATAFNGVEDVEIAPNGQVYFTSKGNGRVYRFTDNGTSISNFITYVGGQNYTINYGTGSASTAWGTGNDNLAFDNEGNLWVNQDGGNGHFWMVRAGHTQASPKVELFAKTPAGSESTGLTFTPDYKFMFLSFQHPTTSNGSQTDASGTSVSINAAAMVVIARKENLGNGTLRLGDNEVETGKVDGINVYPVPFDNEINVEFNLENESKATVLVYNLEGKLINTLLDKTLNAGKQTIALNTQNLHGEYMLYITTNEASVVKRIVSSK